MRFRAHDTFFIRKGWLSKGIRSVQSNPNVFMGYSADGVDKINPMDSLGLGANMVKSLRFWLQAVGLTEEPSTGKKSQALTELGSIINKNDPYIEETGTLCLLHYKLCSNADYATAWHYFYNVFPLRSFSRDDFVTSLENYIRMSDAETVVKRSLEDDFNCIIDTYVPREKRRATRVSPENNIDSPFGDLGLIEIENRKTSLYRKKSVGKTALPPLVALAAIADFSNGEKEIQIGKILNEVNSVGKIFNLDTIALSSLLSDLERLGHLKIIRTAGLDVIRLNDVPCFAGCVGLYYKSIS